MKVYKIFGQNQFVPVQIDLSFLDLYTTKNNVKNYSSEDETWRNDFPGVDIRQYDGKCGILDIGVAVHQNVGLVQKNEGEGERIWCLIEIP